MNPKSLREWFKIYEEKTQDKAEILKGFQLFYLPTRGFMMIKPIVTNEGGVLYVDKVCGDGKFWRDHAELMAQALGFYAIITVCNRNIDSYLKNFGAEILVVKEINKEKRYLCQDCIGRKVLVTYKGKDRALQDEYFVTQYLHEKATTNFNIIIGKKVSDDVEEDSITAS